MTYEQMQDKARFLNRNIDTEWAYNHESEYQAFAEVLETEYSAGEITAEQFDELALEAFYDYPDLKCEY